MDRYKPKRKQNPCKAIREHCIECVGSQINEGWQALIRECPATDCSLHDFRMGKNPFHTQNLSEKERNRRVEQGRALNSDNNQALN